MGDTSYGNCLPSFFIKKKTLSEVESVIVSYILRNYTYLKNKINQ